MASRGRKLQCVVHGPDAAPSALSAPSAPLRPAPAPKDARPQQKDVIKFAPGHAGSMARRAVGKAKHPVIIVQDPEGRHKPLTHEFVPINGRSTLPICMVGHPDDVPGGPLFSTEHAIFERKSREQERKQQKGAKAAEAAPAAAAAAAAAAPKARKPDPQQRPPKGVGKRSSADEDREWAAVKSIFRQVRTRPGVRGAAEAFATGAPACRELCAHPIRHAWVRTPRARRRSFPLGMVHAPPRAPPLHPSRRR